MMCPRCGSELNQMERHAVVLDVCTSCGGMWLDKGELAKVLSHVRAAEATLDAELATGREGAPQAPRSYRQDHREHRHDHDHDHEHEYKHGYGYEHRKKSGLQRLFDIFD